MIYFILLNLFILFSLNVLVYKNNNHDGIAQKIVNIFLLYFFQISITVLFSGRILKDLSILTLTFFNIIISLTVVLILKRYIKESTKDLFFKIRNFVKEILSFKDYFLYIFLFLFFFQFFITLVKIYYLPPHIWDVLAYHLQPVAEWFQQNQIPGLIDTPVYRVNENPHGANLIVFWIFAFFKNIIWLEIPQFLSGVILSISSYLIMFKMGIKKNLSIRYAVLIYFIPIVLLQSRTNQNHLVFTSFIFLALLFLINVFYKEDKKSILYFFISISLLFAIKKHSAAPIVIMCFAILLSKGLNIKKIIHFLRNNWQRVLTGVSIFIIYSGYFILGNRELYNKFLIQKPLSLFKKINIYYFIFLIIFILSLFIYKKYIKKNISKKKIILSFLIIIIFFGSIWFMQSGYAKKETITNIIDHFKNLDQPRGKIINKTKLETNILYFLHRIKDDMTLYHADLSFISGFGVQFFTLGLIGLLISSILFIKKKFRTEIEGFLYIFGMILLFIYFFFYYSQFNYRPNFFFPVIGLILWAKIINDIKLNKIFFYYLDIVLIIFVVFNIFTCFFEDKISAKNFKTMFTLESSSERNIIKHSKYLSGSSWEYIDDFLITKENIGYYGGEDSWMLPFYGNNLDRKIFFIKNIKGFNRKKKVLQVKKQFLEELKNRDIHYLFISKQGLLRKNKLFILDNNSDLIKISEELYYVKW